MVLRPGPMRGQKEKDACEAGTVHLVRIPTGKEIKGKLWTDVDVKNLRGNQGKNPTT